MNLSKLVYLFPEPALYLFIHNKDRKKRSSKIRESVKTLTVQQGLELDSYWKDMGEIGHGPALAVYVLGIMVLKFDCFGLGKGHYHVYHTKAITESGKRIFFSEGTPEAQIKITRTEILNNLAKLLDSSHFERVKRFEVDQAKLIPVLNQIESQLLDLLRYSQKRNST